MSGLHETLDYAAAMSSWFLDAADSRIARGEHERALRCMLVAARVLARQNRVLSCARVEANLQRLAAEVHEPAVWARRAAGSPARSLHVLNEALPAGGHTAMAERWIANDESRVHSVALLGQRVPVPEGLAEAVRRSGGQVSTCDPDGSFVERARWLRMLACAGADHVVLHVDANDVISTVAFGVSGGPPALLVNHGAHIFWTGASVVDRVVNCRGSQLEEHWTRVYRGVPRCATVPIPLAPPEPPTTTRERARESIGVPRDALVLLTLGDSYKYQRAGTLDFVETCEEILRRVPQAVVAVVGAAEDARWGAARERTAGRLRAYGRQPRARVALFRRAADLYVEGFPFGSTTALLEAAMQGLPVVLAPAQCPPPFGTDGVAIDDVLIRPASVEAYVDQIAQACGDAALRESKAAEVRDSVRAHHAGAGWRAHLERAIGGLPAEHAVYPPATPPRTPEAMQAYWTLLRSEMRTGPETALEFSISCALAVGLRPRIGPHVVAACKRATGLRSGRTIPLFVLRPLCNLVLPLLPRTLAARIFDATTIAFGGRVLAGLRNRLARLLEAPSYLRRLRSSSG